MCTLAIPKGRAKLITLTLRSTGAPLELQVSNLWASYRRIRNRKLWRSTVRGSIAVLEITINPRTKRWHPHLHIVADSGYLDSRALSKLWLQCSRSSKIVDVRAIKSPEAAAKYLTSYLAKTTDLPDSVSPDLFAEWLLSTVKVRLYRIHGTLRLPPAQRPTDQNEPADWTTVMSLSAWIVQIAVQDPQALEALRQIDDPRSHSP